MTTPLTLMKGSGRVTTQATACCLWNWQQTNSILLDCWYNTVTYVNKSMSSLHCRLSKWRCPHQPTAGRRCCCAPAHAARRPQLARRAAIDRYFLPIMRSAGNPPATVAAADRRDRQTDEQIDRRTDGRTLDRFIDPAAHTMRDATTNAMFGKVGRSSLKWKKLPSDFCPLAQH